MVIFCKELSRSLQSIIGIISGFIGIVAYVVKISIDYSRLKTRCENLEKSQIEFNTLKLDYSSLKTEVQNNQKRDAEERQKNAEQFSELYASRNKTNDTLTELSTTLKMLVGNINQQFSQLEKKIDELNRR